MALSIVQTIAAFPTSGPATGASAAIGPYNQAAGHFIAVCPRIGSSLTISSVSDTAGNTWHSKAAFGATVKLQWWYAFNCLGNATNTITVNFSGTGNSPQAVMYDVSGAITAVDPTDVNVGVATGVSATSVTSPAFTSTVVNELLLAVATNNVQSTNSWSASGTRGIWTLDGPWPAGAALPDTVVAGGHQLNSSIQTSQTVTLGNGASAGVWVIAVLGITGPAPIIAGGNFLLLDVE